MKIESVLMFVGGVVAAWFIEQRLSAWKGYQVSKEQKDMLKAQESVFHESAWSHFLNSVRGVA